MGDAVASLPTFLLIGATKCGTTSLHRYLSNHADVFMHPQKELRFFTKEHNYRRGLAWYRDQFKAAGSAKAIGEASNAYTRDPVYAEVPERIAAVLPDVQLIYLTRDPMRRIESHYRHRLATAREWRDADTALARDPSYIAASLYGRQIERYLACFDRRQILVLQAEDLFARPQEVLCEVCRFLGVHFDAEQSFRAENETAKRQVAPRGLRMLYGVSRSDRIVGAAKALDRFGFSRQRSASAAPFALSDRGRAELEVLFHEDSQKLAALLGEGQMEDVVERMHG